MPSRRKKSSGGRAFTVEFPEPLPVEKRGDAWWMEADGRELRLSNLDKVFWPDEGYTKGDLVAYYDAVAPLMLTYLRDRPIVLTRYPDGIQGKSFFQKDAPVYVPAWIRTESVYSKDSDREIKYFVVDDALSALLNYRDEYWKPST